MHLLRLIENDTDTPGIGFNSVWKPPGGEIETLLFSLQAAIGAGLIGFCLGYIVGKKNSNENIEDIKSNIND